ncbi:MAG: hypothetical protein ACHQEM_07255 [Chitinophagales bacterium]
MSLNKLRLPNKVIVDLYRHSMVLAGKEKGIDEMEEDHAGPYRYLGGNMKKAVLIVASTESFSVPEKHLSFLVKILESCKMTLADVAILNHASRNIDIHTLKDQINPKKLILFGLEPKQINLPFNSPAFKIQEYDDCEYLYAPSMEDLNRDTEESKILKSKLWVCLRKLFQV